jgi:glutamate racemase
LGCTHYPLLLPIIEKYVPKNVKILTQGAIVAESLYDYLNRHPEMDLMCSKTGKRSFFTTENPEKFNQNASLFLGSEVEAEYLDL